ncbi:Hypoxanthine-guanine phosphoribosyltransferase [Wickerhamomyces ciferrii]|uniref:Hypoxanthine-guanine phosphoribosyltransferase n=1 Tax=Wickerhamomyces ciferrii (strain ATCC 14091 / BCRC 22168 / CBS 111 / JCM 3599 / NBRC 0793 / NRRL Y-1031 F-60-10) TaxID=1206466 RepID=K0KL01_WICCF|nr:Hypoxanthine-guanine phosphoribosyltransferase [Wickerhamomyces ciferrii]CCH43686.1 Hypoxanthine-guanine phosphoribosyltransferase [Wickerhamomyces ciferrii]
MSEEEKVYISYNHVHQLIQESTPRLKKFNPDLILSVAGGGLIPARQVRTFLKEPGSPNVRVMAVVLSLYEDLGSSSTDAEKIGKQVVRTQWLDYQNTDFTLLGKNILIVDEVDDTRTTLNYAVNELKKDVEEQAKAKGISVEEANTNFGIFVLHNKLKPKKADLPAEVYNETNYIAAREIEDVWIAYPWESNDIVTHTRKAIEQGNDVFLP